MMQSERSGTQFRAGKYPDTDEAEPRSGEEGRGGKCQENIGIIEKK